jgi:hypothetical protein
MSDTIQNLLDAGVINTSLFGPNSRYHGVAVAQLTGADGRKVVYLRRRFIPQPDAYAAISGHTVVQGDREDLLASQYLGDPLLAWRLCDANMVLDPAELTARIGANVRITLPAGVPVPSHE